jgi:hypothetical protein
MATLVVLMLVASPDKAGAGGPVFGVLLAAYVLAFLLGRPRLPAVAVGVAAAVLWLALVVIVPPVPGSIALAVVFVAAGAVAALGLTRTPVMALHAAMSAVLAITAAAWALVSYGPERFVPQVVGRSAANPLLENRIETPDGYVGLLAIGAVLAIAVIAVGTRRGRIRGPGPVRLNA